MGRTSLFENEFPAVDRDFAAAKKEWDDAREKAKQAAAAKKWTWIGLKRIYTSIFEIFSSRSFELKISKFDVYYLK